MLDLNSARWNELSHAYGAASDVPDLLRRLVATVEDRTHDATWFDIWSALCHQSDVYTASYAAVPYILAYAAGCKLRERARAIQFAAVVEAYRHRTTAPSIPDDLAAAYDEAILRLLELVSMSTAEVWDQDITQVMIGALAIAKGHPRLGMATMELEAEIDCPECNALFPPRGWDLNE